MLITLKPLRICMLINGKKCLRQMTQLVTQYLNNTVTPVIIKTHLSIILENDQPKKDYLDLRVLTKLAMQESIFYWPSSRTISFDNNIQLYNSRLLYQEEFQN